MDSLAIAVKQVEKFLVNSKKNTQKEIWSSFLVTVRPNKNVFESHIPLND